jgi:hypothetical protein
MKRATFDADRSPRRCVLKRRPASTYQNAGLRVYSIKDQFRPKEVAAFVPPPPAKWVDPRPNRPVVLHSADVFVDKNALCYITDFSAGLYIVEYEG